MSRHGGTYLKTAANGADGLAQSAEDRFNQSNVALETEARDGVGKRRNFERSAFDAGTGMKLSVWPICFNTTTFLNAHPIASGVPAVIGEAMAQRLHGRCVQPTARHCACNLQGFGDFLANINHKWPIAQTSA